MSYQNDVLEWFRKQVHLAGGGHYPTRSNEALKQQVQHQHEPVQATFRRILQEELSCVKPPTSYSDCTINT